MSRLHPDAIPPEPMPKTAEPMPKTAPETVPGSPPGRNPTASSGSGTPSRAERDALLGAANAGMWGEFERRPQGFDAIKARFYEAPIPDQRLPQLWCYSDRLSYRPGEVVQIHGSASRSPMTIRIHRDNRHGEPSFTLLPVALPFTMPQEDFIARGCGWPVIASFRLPDDLPSGFYIITAEIVDDGRCHRQQHGFIVLGGQDQARPPYLLVAATSTWAAYNDWGGGCSYFADSRPDGLPIAPRLSIHRPYARGFIALPPNAPRKRHDLRARPGDLPRYPQFEFAYQRGYSRYYGNAGWASFERLFAHWAEAQGYAFDLACQHDLHFTPDILDCYACVILVGHDEYWSWEMREAVEAYLARGGRIARFGGNFAWQIRLEQEGAVQVCYNRLARSHDPERASRRVTACWEDPLVNWPGAQTFGLNGLWGVYAGFGSLSGKSGGFSVYRPDHWALRGCDLGYGDQFGADAGIFGYEVDGLDYVIRDGLPYPTGRDGAPESVEIIAMGLASNREHLARDADRPTYLPDETPYFAFCRYGEDTEQNRERASRGSGMIVTMPFGEGEVFNAGSIDWVAGLQRNDAETAQITRNVLDRYGIKPNCNQRRNHR